MVFALQVDQCEKYLNAPLAPLSSHHDYSTQALDVKLVPVQMLDRHSAKAPHITSNPIFEYLPIVPLENFITLFSTFFHLSDMKKFSSLRPISLSSKASRDTLDKRAVVNPNTAEPSRTDEILSIYNREAEVYDRRLVEGWRDDMDGALIFVSTTRNECFATGYRF